MITDADMEQIIIESINECESEEFPTIHKMTTFKESGIRKKSKGVVIVTERGETFEVSIKKVE